VALLYIARQPQLNPTHGLIERIRLYGLFNPNNRSHHNIVQSKIAIFPQTTEEKSSVRLSHIEYLWPTVCLDYGRIGPFE